MNMPIHYLRIIFVRRLVLQFFLFFLFFSFFLSPFSYFLFFSLFLSFLFLPTYPLPLDLRRPLRRAALLRMT